MMSPTATRASGAPASRAQASGRSFSALPSTTSTSGIAAKVAGLGLRGAAGDDDPRLRVVAPQPADLLARLAHRLGGDGAGVDHDRVADAGRRGEPLHRLGLVGVEPAAEGGEDRARSRRSAPRNSGESRPSKTSAVGPVIQTPSSRQSITSSPPSSRTVTRRPVSPRRAVDHRGGAGARAAGERDHRRRAPRPASGSSRGRSPARTRRWCARGTAGRARCAAPIAARSTASASGTTKTQCGLPMPTAPGPPSSGSASRSIARASGTSSQVELRRPHVDPDEPAARVLGAQHAAPGPQVERGRRRSRPSAAARRSGWRCRRRRPRVPSAFQKSTSAATPVAGPDHRELVEADAAVAVAERARQRRRHRRAAAAGVDHDEVVAEPVHLQEPEIAGLTIGVRFAIHAPLYRRRLRARPYGCCRADCGLTGGRRA